MTLSVGRKPYGKIEKAGRALRFGYTGRLAPFRLIRQLVVLQGFNRDKVLVRL
jgi:hypothetical protein